MKHNQRLFVPKKLVTALLLAGVSSTAAAQCEYQDLIQSPDIIADISDAEQSCFRSWYNAPEEAAQGLYSEASLQQIQRALATEVTHYRGEDAQAKRIANLSEFVRAAYFARYATQDKHGYYSEAMSQSLAQLSDQFLRSPFARDLGRDQVDAMSGMSLMVDSVKQLPLAMDSMLDMLDSFDRESAQNLQYVDGLNNLFRAMSGHVSRSAFYDDMARHPEYLTRLKTFVDQNQWALGTDAEFLVYNAVRESGRLLATRNDTLREQVLAMMEQTLQQHQIGTPGERLWLAAAEMILFYAPERGAELRLAEGKTQLEQRLLPNRYTCHGPAIIRSQNLSDQQAQKACDVLEAKEADFHDVVNSGAVPVADDHNDQVEVVVWPSNDAYVTYSNFLFGNSTDNGGQYLEGTPSDPNNTARFLAYRYDSGDDLAILNLEHEYVHYLDGRFNLYGGFGDTLSHGNMVWWLEGFAEYMHYKKGYQAAIDLASDANYSLSDVFATDYNHDVNRIYRWGYLAVRFMIENHPADVDRLLQLGRSGEYQSWAEEVKRLGPQYDSEFATWLTTLSSEEPGTDHGNDNNDNGDQSDDAMPSFGMNHSAHFSADQYEEQQFYIDIPDGVTSFTVTTRGDGDSDLYASYQKVAHYYDYQVSEYGSGSDEVITFTPQSNGFIAPGRYYFSLTARESFSDVEVISQVETSSPAKAEDDLTPLLLTNGQAVNLDINETRYAGLYVDRPAVVRVWLSSVGEKDGEVDLYVGRQSWASTEDFDLASQHAGSNEYVEMTVEQPGYVHFTLDAQHPGGRVELKATY